MVPSLHPKGISDSVLTRAISHIERGLVDADLGGGVIKQRIPRPGQGKSGSHRTIIFFRRNDRAIFVFGFPKSQLSNITATEAQAFREAAKHLLALNEKQLRQLIHRGDFLEIKPQ